MLLVGCGGPKVPPLSIDHSATVKPMKNGKLHGVKKVYLGNGILYQEQSYVNGIAEGVWKRYNNRTGKILYYNEFSNGKKNGLERIYHWKKGYLEQEANYVNDLKEGIERHYDKSGKLVKEIPYVNGKKNGVAKSYGRLAYIETSYNDDMKDGKQVHYALDRKTVLETHHYRKNNEHGIEKFFDEKGRLLYTAKWVNGERKWLKMTPRMKKAKNKQDRERKLKELATEKRKKVQQASNGGGNAQLRCSFGSNDYSLAQIQHKEAVARGAGEGAGLAYSMKGSSSNKHDYCVNAASSYGESCRFARVYLNGCLSKVGY